MQSWMTWIQSSFFLYYRQMIWIILLFTVVSILFNFILLSRTYLSRFIQCLFSGNGTNCFGFPRVDECNQEDIGSIYGWCNDPNRIGPLVGTEKGPDRGRCYNWYWKQCPPKTCQSIGRPSYQGRVGWCYDYDLGLRGSACGPHNTKCRHWIWDPIQCTSCQTTKTTKSENMKTEDTVTTTKTNEFPIPYDTIHPSKNLICGEVNGKKIPCPFQVEPSDVKHCQLTCGQLTKNGETVKCPPSCNAHQDPTLDECQCPSRESKYEQFCQRLETQKKKQVKDEDNLTWTEWLLG